MLWNWPRQEDMISKETKKGEMIYFSATYHISFQFPCYWISQDFPPFTGFQLCISKVDRASRDVSGEKQVSCAPFIFPTLQTALSQEGILVRAANSNNILLSKGKGCPLPDNRSPVAAGLTSPVSVMCYVVWSVLAWKFLKCVFLLHGNSAFLNLMASQFVALQPPLSQARIMDLQGTYLEDIKKLVAHLLFQMM